MRHGIKQIESGFTIIELMIASLVFATILMIVTSAIIELSHTYLKSANDANTQNVARNIEDNVTKAVQFSTDDTDVNGPSTNNSIASNGAINYNTRWYCANNQIFIFNDGVIYNDTGTTPDNLGLISSPLSTPCPISSAMTRADVSGYISTGIELLSPNMAVSRFIISETSLASHLYNINLIISSAPNITSLCDSSLASGATAGCGLTDPTATDPSQVYLPTPGGVIKCKYQQGDHLCASEALDSLVALETKL